MFAVLMAVTVVLVAPSVMLVPSSAFRLLPQLSGRPSLLRSRLPLLQMEMSNLTTSKTE